MLPHSRAGKIRLLAVTNSERTPVAPEVPRAAEVGYHDLPPAPPECLKLGMGESEM